MATDSYAFDITEYRPGIPLLRDYGLSSSQAILDAYKAIPPAVWLEVNRLFVTGVASSIQHLRALLKHTLLKDVPDELVFYHFSQNFETLATEREAYLEDLYNSQIKQQHKLSGNPSDQKFHRIACNLAVLLDAMTTMALENKVSLSPKDLQTLSRTLKDLREADPMSERGEKGDPGKQAAMKGANQKLRDVMEAILHTHEGETEETDRIVNNFINRTEKILEDT